MVKESIGRIFISTTISFPWLPNHNNSSAHKHGRETSVVLIIDQESNGFILNFGDNVFSKMTANMAAKSHKHPYNSSQTWYRETNVMSITMYSWTKNI